MHLRASNTLGLPEGGGGGGGGLKAPVKFRAGSAPGVLGWRLRIDIKTKDDT